MTNFNYANLDPARRAHFVYRCYAADGRLLYVGRTVDPARRTREHRADRRRWLPQVARVRMFGPTSYEMAKRMELEAIHTEAPRYNQHGAPRTRNADRVA